MSERKRLTEEVARLHQDSVLAQKASADMERHLKSAALESQAAAERAENKCATVLLIKCLVIAVLHVMRASENSALCNSTTFLIELNLQG